PPPPTATTTAAAGSSTATATPPRPRSPRATSTPAVPGQTPAQRTAAKEEADYQEARWQLKDRYQTRRHGDVVIFWENPTSWDRIECVAILTASNPRHEIRRNGVVIHTEPATRKWQAERKDLIERAKPM
ncbi:MAG: hypothetical protein WCG26_05450, partial [Chloroflexales bacterium]